MSDEYHGPERRNIDSPTEMLIRIDERTLHMADEMKKLATVERVQAVEGRIDRHIKSHVSAAGLYAAWGGVAVAIGFGLFGVFGK